VKLNRRYVEKPWGRMQLPATFDPPKSKRIGEVWFTNGADLPLLVKYIFTGEPLSIQVHPDDTQARAHGLTHGKSECWYIVDAEPGATIGLGLKRELSAEEIRGAALDGSIEDLVDWRPIRPRDFYLVPAGTIHAIGAGVSLLELQQNVDLTYRLYDYGRSRELHVEDAIRAAQRGPFPEAFAQHLSVEDERTLVDSPQFTLIHSHTDALHDRRRWVVPLVGRVRCGREAAGPGECLVVEAGGMLACDGARMLIGASGQPS
jgi:mannose-6-phosphate isomerase